MMISHNQQNEEIYLVFAFIDSTLNTQNFPMAMQIKLCNNI